MSFNFKKYVVLYNMNTSEILHNIRLGEVLLTKKLRVNLSIFKND